MLKHNIQDNGTLSFTNFSDLPFQPKRIMTMYNVPKGESRGHHGHRKTKQLLVCVHGRIKVTLIDKDSHNTHILKPGDSLFQETYVWGKQEYLDDNTVMVVLCSEEFDKTEYIYDIEEITGA